MESVPSKTAAVLGTKIGEGVRFKGEGRGVRFKGEGRGVGCDATRRAKVNI